MSSLIPENVTGGFVSVDNSSTTPLGISGVFTGIWIDTISFANLSVSVKADVASATDGLLINWSPNGSTIVNTDEFTIPAGIAKTFTFGPANRYVQIVYTNGVVAQTTFNLETILRKVMVKSSSHRIADAIINDDDAELVKAVLTGLAPDGTFKNVLVTNSGNQKISIEELESSVSSNSNSQLNVTPFASDGTEYKVDSTTGAAVNVDYAHSEIHSGDHFFNKNWTDLAGSGTYDILLVTPNTDKLSHFSFIFSAEAEFNIILYSGTTTSSDGTPMTVVNRNPTIGTANGMLVYHTPTVTAVGTQLARYKGGSGKSSGGELNSNNEVILVKNTKYLARITNDTVTNNWIDWLIDWYEHTSL